MTTFRRPSSPSRWAWLLPLVAAGLAASCDNSLAGIGSQGTWGFVILSASKSQTGAHYTSPEGLFFKGNLASVPNADFTGDTCADVAFSEGNNLGGVTYLDAGPSVQTILGGTTTSLDRTTTSEGIAYQLAAGSVAFTPGDSIVVNVTGANGGYPGGTIRAKTAEPFTFPTVDPPGGTETIQLSWSPPQDPRSAMIVSLRYATSSSPSVLTRNVLCTFVDDGVDSIPFRWHQNWSSSAGIREVVATRLRTNYVAAGEGNLGVISTYQVPTPPHP